MVATAQQNAYEPFPIYDMRGGKVTAREPWLLPKDAFEKLRNGHLFRGVLEKRKGYTEFGRIVHTDTTADTDTNPANAVMGLYDYYEDDVESLLAMDTARVNKYDTGTDAFVDLTRQVIHYKPGASQDHAPAVADVCEGATSGAYGTIEAVIIDHGTHAGGDADGWIIFENGTINGTFQTGENLRDKNTPANIYGDSDGTPDDYEFTGDDTNYFWFENWDNIGYMANAIDQIMRYNGTCLAPLQIDLDVEGGPDNDVNTCLLILKVKSRLVLFRTTERGTAHYRRARYCEVDDPQTWKDDSYIDAPADDWIMSAELMGDEVFVWFERSIWKFEYTADADLPFRWDRVVSTEGCYATYSLISFSDEIIGVGPTRIISCDGRDAKGIDEKIPDFMLEWNQSAVGYCYGLVLEEMRQALISYTSLEADTPDSAVVLNYDDNCYSTYALPIHCLGYSALESDLVLDEIDATIALDDIDYSFDDRELQAGYPTTLMGTTGGYIYQLNDGGSDDGSNIEFEAITGRWNPYSQEGRKAQLGYVDFLVDVDEDVSFTVQLYMNSEVSSYDSRTINCDDPDDTGKDKVWKRANVNVAAGFHRLELTNNDTGNRPRIHAIVPWFKRAGRLI